jgi:uncharacterized protein YkwD
MYKAMVTIAALAFLLGATAAPGQDSGLATAPDEGLTLTLDDGTRLYTEEALFIKWANHERDLRGLSTLEPDGLLVEVAREHSRDMAERDYFDHYSPITNLRTPLDRYLAHIADRPQWVYVGENLYYCSIVDPARGHRKLMESPTHKENILDPKFERIGVGIYISPDGRFWVTEMFCAESPD